MKINKFSHIAGYTLLTMIIAVGTVVGSEGSGSITLGYNILDEEGNKGVNQQTYNEYEGFAVSFNNWQYSFDNGVKFTANLLNTTLNNRNIRASLYKAGKFSLSGFNNQYRRTYDFDGYNFTRRRSSGGKASYQINKYVKLFGGYNTTNKHGDQVNYFSFINDTLFSSTDYTHGSFNAGVQVYDKYGNFRAEYQNSNFNDNTSSDRDRESDNLNLTASTMFPGYNQIILAGGYHHRSDKYSFNGIELKTNQGWGAVKFYLPENFVFDYRILFARTLQTESDLETDNAINTLSLSKNWISKGGLRVGFENRIADDLVNRSQSNGLLFNGWFKFNTKLTSKAMFSLRNKEIVTGTTLIGDENYTRYKISSKFTDQWGTISLQWQGRERENKDFNTSLDYNALSTELLLRNKKFGKVIFNYTYNIGEFENRDQNVNYEFTDHVLSGSLYPLDYKQFSFVIGGTYYRSQRDLDIEKISLNFAVGYSFLKDHQIELKYNVHHYDDLLHNKSYYTANIFELNLIKDLTI